MTRFKFRLLKTTESQNKKEAGLSYLFPCKTINLRLLIYCISNPIKPKKLYFPGVPNPSVVLFKILCFL